MTKVISFLDDFLSSLSSRQRKVLVQRFGLNGSKRTLQEIGDDLSITRERVRQIEEYGLKKSRQLLEEHLLDFIKEAEKQLDSMEGVAEDDLFLNTIIKTVGFEQSIKNLKNKLRFLFFLARAPLFFREDPELKSFWYNNEEAKKKVINFLKQTISLFEDAYKAESPEEDLAKLKEFQSHPFLSISKKFATNVFGDLGLVDWPEIQPKSVREKAYLALKKHKKPLHFIEIAKNIKKSGISTGPVNAQTVHNELIKDERFVLIGRGIYALREHGYESGSVKEVIATLLKEKGPLTAGEVVRLVNEKRMLKETTILLSLQNRKNFQCIGSGKYTVREA